MRATEARLVRLEARDPAQSKTKLTVSVIVEEGEDVESVVMAEIERQQVRLGQTFRRDEVFAIAQVIVLPMPAAMGTA